MNIRTATPTLAVSQVFLTALGESPYFENVELKETELLEQEGLKLNEFKLRATLSKQGPSHEEDITTAGVGG